MNRREFAKLATIAGMALKGRAAQGKPADCQIDKTRIEAKPIYQRLFRVGSHIVVVTPIFINCIGRFGELVEMQASRCKPSPVSRHSYASPFREADLGKLVGRARSDRLLYIYHPTIGMCKVSIQSDSVVVTIEATKAGQKHRNRISKMVGE